MKIILWGYRFGSKTLIAASCLAHQNLQEIWELVASFVVKIITLQIGFNSWIFKNQHDTKA